MKSTTNLSFFKNTTLKSTSLQPPKDNLEAKPKVSSSGFRSNIEDMTVVTDDGGILKKIDRPGNGKVPPLGSTVWIHYVVFDEKDLSKPIDSSRERKHPYAFKLLNHDVYAVLDYGVATMELKEKAHFLTKPVYAYGPLGIPGICKPETNCVFHIELIDFVDDMLSKDLLRLNAEQRSDVSYDMALKAATQLKEEGNKHCSANLSSVALGCYRKTIVILERYSTTDPELEVEKNALLFTIYNNMALCHLQREEGRRALEACSKARSLPSETVGNRCKLYFREAKAYWQLDKFELAQESARIAMTFEPSNKCVSGFYEELSLLNTLELTKSKELCKAMSQWLRGKPALHKQEGEETDTNPSH